MIVWGVPLEALAKLGHLTGVAASPARREYRILGQEGWNVRLLTKEGRPYHDKKSKSGVCLHGHAEFIEHLFTAFPEAVVKTHAGTYIGRYEFERYHERIEDRAEKKYGHLQECECEEEVPGGDMSVIDANVVH